MADPYLDPETGVLSNLLGARDELTLAVAEGRLTYHQEMRVHGEPELVPGDLDVAQAVHRWLFGAVYAWAGELRTVQISKDDSTFALPEHLHSAADEVFKRLSADGFLRGRGAAEFAAGAARLLGDLNALHPFRDGNGRTQRAFLQIVADRAGWQVAWASVSAEEMLSASKRAMVDVDAFAPLVSRIVALAEPRLPGVARVLRRLESDPPSLGM